MRHGSPRISGGEATRRFFRFLVSLQDAVIVPCSGAFFVENLRYALAIFKGTVLDIYIYIS